jgi:hypothetical protein
MGATAAKGRKEDGDMNNDVYSKEHVLNHWLRYCLQRVVNHWPRYCLQRVVNHWPRYCLQRVVNHWSRYCLQRVVNHWPLSVRCSNSGAMNWCYISSKRHSLFELCYNKLSSPENSFEK